MDSKHFSLKIKVFHGRLAPEESFLVGYGALIEAYQLKMPMPSVLTLISEKKRQYNTKEWKVFTSRHLPKDTLYHQIVFALKYEGVNLLFFKKLFTILSKEECTQLVQIEPLGQYSRKIWFLYEWLMQSVLPIENLKTGNYVALLDEQQFAIQQGFKSSRHRIINNLPGTVDFCPLIFKTPKLIKYIHDDLKTQNKLQLTKIHRDILLRTSAFLLLKDSKASFNIEGESPVQSRALRWGRVIGETAKHQLSKLELERLQQIVIENNKFLKYGYRTQDGFVGEHDRETHHPIPEHMSAKYSDIEQLSRCFAYRRAIPSSFNSSMFSFWFCVYSSIC